jgi:hypothetical protein
MPEQHGVKVGVLECVMPIVKRFTRGQWEAFGRRLDALPEKAQDEQPLKIGDGVKSIREQISAARQKGYTLNELSKQAAHDGMDIGLNSLKYAMRRAEGKHHVAREKKKAPRSNVSEPTARNKSPQASAAQDSPPRNDASQKRSGQTAKPSIPEGNNFLGFPIRPDTENL